MPLEWRLIAYNLKSICPKSNTLDKAGAPCQLQNYKKNHVFSNWYILILFNAH